MKNLITFRKVAAFAAVCFGFLTLSEFVYAQTWTGCTTPPFTLTTTTTVGCGKYCGPGPTDNPCDNCVTFTIHNNSTVANPCDITQLTIFCNDQGICFSICCPAQFGTADITDCNGNTTKTFSGHFRQGSPDMSFSICYTGSGPHTFAIYESAGVGSGCCIFTPPPSANNYYVYTF